MVFEVDRYLDRRFDLERYNCWDFVKEVWRDLRGQELDVSTVDQAQGRYESLMQAISPCLVLMQGVSQLPHVGIYYQGRVLNLQKAGVRYQPLHIARLGFHTVSFYVPR